jgi:hypothetical protein
MGACPWKNYWDPRPFLCLSFCFPAVMWWEASSTTCYHHEVLLCLYWRQWANWPWTKTSKIVSQNKTFLLIDWLSQIVCHNNGKLCNTVINKNMGKDRYIQYKVVKTFWKDIHIHRNTTNKKKEKRFKNGKNNSPFYQYSKFPSPISQKMIRFLPLVWRAVWYNFLCFILVL